MIKKIIFFSLTFLLLSFSVFSQIEIVGDKEIIKNPEIIEKELPKIKEEVYLSPWSGWVNTSTYFDCKDDLENKSCIPEYRIVTTWEIVKYVEKTIIEIDKFIYKEIEYDGYFNVKEDKVYKWKYPIGNRNMDEYGTCRQYEIDKGVCEEIL